MQANLGKGKSNKVGTNMKPPIPMSQVQKRNRLFLTLTLNGGSNNKKSSSVEGGEVPGNIFTIKSPKKKGRLSVINENGYD